MSEAAGLLAQHPWLPRRKLDVREYHRMGAAGILHEDDRVELIEGELIPMAPVGADHSGTIIRFTRILVLSVEDRALVSPQNPVRLDEWNEPQPDFLLLRPRPDDYRGGVAHPEDVLLLIEVAVSSLRYDRSVKLPLYSTHGIAEVWIVDVAARRIEVCRGASASGYTSVTMADRDAILEPIGLPGLRLKVSDLLP